MIMFSRLFSELHDIILNQPGTEKPLAIQTAACTALTSAIAKAEWPSLDPSAPALPQPFIDVMTAQDADGICEHILSMPFSWAPPTTSDSPLYLEHNHSKMHVELLGPDGLVPTDSLRLGLYGILPHSEYGIRTHPAEEIFIMLAGEADWLRGDAPYQTHGRGTHSYHPSEMPHATRTHDKAFMSVYIWYGDVSTERYHYQGLPQ